MSVPPRTHPKPLWQRWKEYREACKIIQKFRTEEVDYIDDAVEVWRDVP